MSTNLGVTSPSTNTGTTANPQPNNQSNYQGQTNNSVQNIGVDSGINNSPRGGHPETIKNFSINSLVARDGSSTTTNGNGLSSLAIGVIIAIVVVVIAALYLGSKVNKVRPRKA